MGIRVQCDNCGEMISPRESHVCKPVRVPRLKGSSAMCEAMGVNDPMGDIDGTLPPEQTAQGDAGSPRKPSVRSKHKRSDRGRSRKSGVARKSGDRASAKTPAASARKGTAKRKNRTSKRDGDSAPSRGRENKKLSVKDRRRGRPAKGDEAKTLTATKPWLKEGISRASWYRRQGKK